MTELAAVRGETNFVMKATADYAILRLTGRLVVEELRVEPGEIQFWIERPEGRGGGFLITEQGWGRADWLPAEASIRALEFGMKEGYPTFSLRVQGAAV